MKVGKIILGVFLIFAIGNEFTRAGFEIGSFFNPGVIVGIAAMLIFIAWLFGSGISKEKLKLFTLPFLKYYIITLGLFVIVALFSLTIYKAPKEYVEYNGIKISIGDFYTMSKRLYPNDAERREYILCIASKMAYSEEIVKNYRTELERGQFTKIFQKLQGNSLLNELGLQECAGLMEINWTESKKKELHRALKGEFYGTNFEKTNDVEELCDCLLNEFTKFSLSKYLSKEFQNGEERIQIIEKCKELSKK